VIAGPGPARKTGSLTPRVHPFTRLRRGLVLRVGAQASQEPSAARLRVQVAGVALSQGSCEARSLGSSNGGRGASWVEFLAVRSSRVARYRQLGAAWVSLAEQGSGQGEPDVAGGEQCDQRECGAGQ
jgi:hypothetical protein